ncbi:MAG: hypothetical protein Q7I95_02750 [Thiobacillus sp.]|nr:hypothetical protein [Thiobacillus sp.]
MPMQAKCALDHEKRQAAAQNERDGEHRPIHARNAFRHPHDRDRTEQNATAERDD